MARQGRAVVLVNAGISIAIVAVIAGVSVFRAPASPPTVQEFAPAHPARQLTDEGKPEPTATSSYASGPLTRPTKARGVPSALQCWAWPDGSTTQTFDRQSPPCVSSWDTAAGNGGATSRGVTRTEVRVGVPAASVSAWQPLAMFFSRHYQLYGRTIRLVPLGVAGLDDAEGQRALAASAAEHAVFAALDDPAASAVAIPRLDVYLDSLANERIVSVLTRSTQVSSTTLSAQAPYSWTVPPPMDTTQRTLATAVCRELSGHRAQYSKQTSHDNRRFALLIPRGLDTSAFSAGLETCHVTAASVEYDPSDPRGIEARLSAAHSQDVTTVIPFGSASVVADILLPAASQVDYQPEWLIPGLTQQQEVRSWALAPKEQLRSLFGLSAWAKPLSESRTPAAQALHEIVPSARFDSTQQSVYDGLALLAAGLQLAGPRPTPQAFADGLATTTFANPGAGRTPVYQARVGFEDVDHTMVDDVAQVWWRGDGFCFVGNGRRWSADELAFTDPGFFDSKRGC